MLICIQKSKYPLKGTKPRSKGIWIMISLLKTLSFLKIKVAFKWQEAFFLKYFSYIYPNFHPKFHPNLSFTFGTSKKNVNFLELNLTLRGGTIHTELCIKPTDGRQYLHYQSSIPIKLKCQYHTANH